VALLYHISCLAKGLNNLVHFQYECENQLDIEFVTLVDPRLNVNIPFTVNTHFFLSIQTLCFALPLSTSLSSSSLFVLPLPGLPFFFFIVHETCRHGDMEICKNEAQRWNMEACNNGRIE